MKASRAKGGKPLGKQVCPLDDDPAKAPTARRANHEDRGVHPDAPVTKDAAQVSVDSDAAVGCFCDIIICDEATNATCPY